jgi:phosphonate transport system substrate-binding protein
MLRFTGFTLAALAILAVASGLVLGDLSDIEHRSARPPAVHREPAPPPAGATLRIGVISRFAPNLIYAGYQPIIDYLNDHSPHHFELKLSTSYLDAVEHLRTGDVVASFLGAWLFSHLEDDTSLVPLAAPLNGQGASEFHAILVVRRDSPIDSLADLEGCRVAAPSAQSWSGNWLQSRGLARAGLTVSDLDTLHHFDHHQTVVWRILRGDFDAGVVKESVAARFHSEGLLEVARSAPIPGPPLVGSRHAPADVLAEIRDLLVSLDPGDARQRAELASWSPEFAHGLVAVDRQVYGQESFAHQDGPPTGKAP